MEPSTQKRRAAWIAGAAAMGLAFALLGLACAGANGDPAPTVPEGGVDAGPPPCTPVTDGATE